MNKLTQYQRFLVNFALRHNGGATRRGPDDVRNLFRGYQGPVDDRPRAWRNPAEDPTDLKNAVEAIRYSFRMSHPMSVLGTF